jgi:hypothetical protein
MARPVDYRKSRGRKGVHTEDEQVPVGKKDQGRNADLNGWKHVPPKPVAHAEVGKRKHSAGHVGQKPLKRR